MGTVPTDKLERELRKTYLQWLGGLSKQENVPAYIAEFQRTSEALIKRLGGQVASLGALGGFPVPKTLALSPHAGTIYNEMQQAAISASITAGLNSRDAARQMLNAGLDKSYKKLVRLARTETVSAYWKNQWDSTADLPLIVMVWGVERSKRTCDYCISRDGLVVEDGNIRDHPNGRCTLIPTLRSQVKYKGTLQSDGSVFMDPAWTGKAAKTKASSTPVTQEQLDPLSSKSNPAAPSQAQAAQASPAKTAAPQEVKAASKTAALRGTETRVIKSVKDMEDFGLGMPVPSAINAKAAKVVDDYAKGTAYTANAVLRGQKTYLGRAIDARTKAYTKTFTKDMDKMMESSLVHEQVQVVRTVQMDAFGGVENLKKLAGTVYEDKGYMSTSLAEKVSSKIYSAKDGVDMEIIVPKGTKALYMAGESYLKSERELLLNRGTKLNIKSVTQDAKTGKWKVQAEVVPDTDSVSVAGVKVKPKVSTPTPAPAKAAEWKPTMTKADADVWAKDSAIPGDMLHGTNQAAAKSIRSGGFNTDSEVYGRMLGNGVYLTENQATMNMYAHGAELTLRVNVKNPVEMNDIWSNLKFGDIFDAEMAAGGDAKAVNARAITRFAHQEGHDALIKRAPDGSIDELVVFDPKNVVVIK